uniref:Uncharacterized protein n=1 Tax=Meloidogyne enterolobii TaxID=390850 RepID=A0A6V7XN07_MELEN|nr:unnamed protein product [Meloidogyne enterolobii]
MNNSIYNFKLQLIHDPQIANTFDVDIVVEINFVFDLRGHSNMGTKHLNDILSKLEISSRSKTDEKNKNIKYYANHIGPGMPIVVLIKLTRIITTQLILMGVIIYTICLYFLLGQ